VSDVGLYIIYFMLYLPLHYTCRSVSVSAQYKARCLESSETWCSRRMEKISETDRVRNDKVLRRVSKERNILQTIRSRKANWIGHLLRKTAF